MCSSRRAGERRCVGFHLPILLVKKDIDLPRRELQMTIRIAAIEVSHWHALYDAAYLRHLVAMPDVELVAIQDSDAGLVARRAAEVGSPSTFTDYPNMLATSRPDFVVALGRHRQMAGIAHELLDQRYPS